MIPVALATAVLLALVLTALLGQPESASAHANLVRTDPAEESVLDGPPTRVTIWYSEPIEATLGKIRVFDAEGEQVDNEDNALVQGESSVLSVTLPELENGTYSVSWGIISISDGHSVVGSFRFAVGEPISDGVFVSVEQPLLQSITDPWLRWLFLAAILLFSGTLIIDALVIGPVWSDSRPSTQRGDALVIHSQQIYRIAWFAIVLASIALVAIAVQQASNSFDVSVIAAFGTPLFNVIFDTAWGTQWLWRALFLIVAAIFLELGRQLPARSTVKDGRFDLPITSSRFGQIGLIAGLAILFTTSLNSHAAALPSDTRLIGIANDFLHLLAAAAWVGGLLFLGVQLPYLYKKIPAGTLNELTSAIIPSFTALALGSAALLILTGVLAGWLQITIPQATATPYGWALVSKIALLVPLGVLAAVNSFWVSIALLRDERSYRRLSSLVVAEASIALLIVLAAGWMTGLEPGRQFAGRNGIGVTEMREFSATENRTSVDLQVIPGSIGDNTARLQLTDVSGRPLTGASVSDVRIRLKFLEQELGEPLKTMVPEGNGIWVSEGFPIGIAGLYAAELEVVRTDAFDTQTSFRFETDPVGDLEEPITPSPTITWGMFGAELVLLGLIAFAMTKSRIAQHRPGSVLVPAAGATSAIIGIFALLNASVFSLGIPQEQINPVGMTEQSVQMGRSVYVESCASCHGESGAGDGPEAGFIAQTPTNLILDTPVHSDGELFDVIKGGIPGTPMRSTAGLLDDVEIWNIVNYLRTLDRQ